MVYSGFDDQNVPSGFVLFDSLATGFRVRCHHAERRSPRRALVRSRPWWFGKIGSRSSRRRSRVRLRGAHAAARRRRGLRSAGFHGGVAAVAAGCRGRARCGGCRSREALQVALHQNLGIVARARAGRGRRTLGIAVAKGAFEPTLTASVTITIVRTRRRSRCKKASVGENISFVTDDWRATLTDRLETGTLLSLDFSNGRARSSVGHRGRAAQLSLDADALGHATAVARVLAGSRDPARSTCCARRSRRSASARSSR